MDADQAVGSLAALAHEHRLAVYRLLVEAGPAGLPAGAIATRLALAPSSLTFHLQQLRHAGLITQTRSSRQVICAADFDSVNELVAYLTENCCGRSGSTCASMCEPDVRKVAVAARGRTRSRR